MNWFLISAGTPTEDVGVDQGRGLMTFTQIFRSFSSLVQVRAKERM